MRTELDAVRLDFSDFGQAEHLETAAVGQDRVWPVDEPVQTARRANDFDAGPNREMVGVAEDDLGSHLPQFARVERLDAALSSDRHENRSVNGSVRGGQTAQTRLSGRIGLEQLEHAPGRLITFG